MSLQVERWGKVKRTNPRRRFYKVQREMLEPFPFSRVLVDYTDIYNVITVEFDYVDDKIYPPRVMSRCRTSLNSDTLSQAQYGVRALTVRVGAMIRKDAIALRNEYLKQYAQPLYELERR